MELIIYQVDAFTKKKFKGNPAAVCILDYWLPDGILQAIAAENNLSETAFVCKGETGVDLRWFTPKTEVDLCGHATLASAHVVLNELDWYKSTVNFNTRSGTLSVHSAKDDMLNMDFPMDDFQPIDLPEGISVCFDRQPVESFRGKDDLLLIYESQSDIEQIQPDFRELLKLPYRGIIITAPSDIPDIDFVSRFFAPAYGIDEDPVTGSAHTLLAPFWSEKLDKKKLRAKQLSERGGELLCRLGSKRVHISGHAVTVLTGKMLL
jgi:PhzF family phenazine biosynthesis protein